MRSLLFVPGDSPAKLDKGLASPADALILDLEDSVARARKPEARRITVAFLARARALERRPRLVVRINPLDGPEAELDLEAIAPAHPDAVMLPKAKGGPDIMLLGARLAAREALAELPDGAIRIFAIATETAAALFHMGSYQGASQRLEGLTWGAEDLSADLGAETNRLADGSYADPYRLARALTVIAATAAAVTPIDTVYTNFRDLDGLRREAEAARRDGFVAKMAIHPAQVPVINEVFTPSPAAIDHAKAVIGAFAGAGNVGVVGLDGEMLDRPHLIRAERVLARAKAAGSPQGSA